MHYIFKQLLLSVILFCALFCCAQSAFCSGQINWQEEYESVKDTVLLDPNFEPQFKVILLKRYVDEFDKYITELKNKYPNSYKPYYYSGVWYSARGIYEKAIENLNKAIELAPDNVYIYEYRAVLNMNAGYFDKVMDDAEKAISLAPDKRRPYEYKLIAAIQLLKFNTALNTIKVMKQLPKSKKDIISDENLERLEKGIKRSIRDSRGIDWD